MTGPHTGGAGGAKSPEPGALRGNLKETAKKTRLILEEFEAGVEIQ